MAEIYAGLMSGTSMDGVDGVLLEFSADRPCVTHAVSVALPPDLRSELMALNVPGRNELHRAALAANGLAHTYSDVISEAAIEIWAIASRNICCWRTWSDSPSSTCIGIYVAAEQSGPVGRIDGYRCGCRFSQPLRRCWWTGRSPRSIFHQALFLHASECIAVLNLGGISNLTVLLPEGAEEGSLVGFDCGPGNALMDHWCQKHTGHPFDDAGAWAASGRVHPGLLDTFLADPYFALPPPKSTGRDLFNPDWLAAHLTSSGSNAIAVEDVQATLCEFTVSSCAKAVCDFAQDATEILVCGGGAYNLHLMKGLQRQLPGCKVTTSAEKGIPPTQVEAAAFAWLARKTILREALPLKSTTGAKGSRILGCVYPA